MTADTRTVEDVERQWQDFRDQQVEEFDRERESWRIKTDELRAQMTRGAKEAFAFGVMVGLAAGLGWARLG